MPTKVRIKNDKMQIFGVFFLESPLSSPFYCDSLIAFIPLFLHPWLDPLCVRNNKRQTFRAECLPFAVIEQSLPFSV
jgi:hypothetical protein